MAGTPWRVNPGMVHGDLDGDGCVDLEFGRGVRLSLKVRHTAQSCSFRSWGAVPGFGGWCVKRGLLGTFRGWMERRRGLVEGAWVHGNRCDCRRWLRGRVVWAGGRSVLCWEGRSTGVRDGSRALWRGGVQQFRRWPNPWGQPQGIAPTNACPTRMIQALGGAAHAGPRAFPIAGRSLPTVKCDLKKRNAF